MCHNAVSRPLRASATAVIAKNEKVATPKEYGAYIKTNKGLIRLLPNIVFDEDGVIFVESNNPAHFLLKDSSTSYSTEVRDERAHREPHGILSAVGPRQTAFRLRQGHRIDVRPQGKDMYIIKPKGLLGRGYYSI
jgi:hypothetical protein